MIPAQLLLYLPQIIGVLFIAILILFNKDPKRRSRLFALPMFLIGAWLSSQLIAQAVDDPTISLLFVRFTAAFACIMVVSYNLAIRRYLNKSVNTAYSVSLVLIAAAAGVVSIGGNVIRGATADINGISIDDASPVYFGLTIFIAYVFIDALIRLYRATKRLPKNERSGNYILFFSTLQCVVLSGGGSIFLAHIAAAQVLIFVSALVFCVGMLFGIIRHKLFDVRLIIVRTIGYGLSVITLAVVYFILAYVVSRLFFSGDVTTGVSFSPVNIALALILAFIFQPVKTFFDRITNKIFYREHYTTEEFFGLLSNVLSLNTNLRDLLDQASEVIGLNLKSSQTFFFVRYGDSETICAGTRGHDCFSDYEARALDSVMQSMRKGAIEVSDLVRKRHAYAALSRHNVTLLLPLWHENKIMGYLALGESLGSIYSRRDIRVLSTIADELVIAIQNALSLEQVREVNANLEERIEGATKSLRRSNEKLKRLDDTKDEFISMASHQLRTPLTSVKGYVSMLLDGDAGPINDVQRKFLTEAFDSSNRMAGIIGDFLNVSRLQTGKFGLERETVDLGEVVESEVQHLSNTARTRGLTLNFHRPARFPDMQLDKSKIEQVVMNFIDNAIFYAPNTGEVDIELFQRAGRAVFTVRDHGIGVPKHEQASLFTKFFRATNARHKRPDGTGVGLFLAKKVVVAHRGAIIFDSIEGKGSTFGFEIPLA